MQRLNKYLLQRVQFLESKDAIVLAFSDRK